MFYTFDSAATTWETAEVEGGCDAAAFKLGAGDVIEFMTAYSYGFGYGPMVGGEFEDTLSGAVGDSYLTDWAGQVGQGWLLEAITGEESLGARNYTFVYDMEEDGDVSPAENPIEGAGDSDTPVDGWYVSNGFFGWGWE
jgi:hypothetical protein